MGAETEGSTTLNVGVGGDVVREYLVRAPDGTVTRQQIVAIADSQGRQIPLDITGLLTLILGKLEDIHEHMELNS